MSLPFNIARVHERVSLVEGYELIKNSFPAISKYDGRVITYPDAVYTCLDVVSEDYFDWPEDQGFGSSDMTYVLKSFIDEMIRQANLSGYYETAFRPYLKVVEYSEADHHEAQLRRKQGI